MTITNISAARLRLVTGPLSAPEVQADAYDPLLVGGVGTFSRFHRRRRQRRDRLDDVDGDV